ncbi:host specificity J domain protein [Escherichia coli P0304816.2]|nr:host specificity J domain protein [Escherichia coli P0304816.2]
MGKRLGAADVENGRCMSSASTATSQCRTALADGAAHHL